MDFNFNADQTALYKSIVAFAKTELENENAADRDRHQTFSRALWKKCAAHKLHALSVPEELGGAGLDSLSTTIAMEAFGYGCEDGGFVFAVGAHHFATANPIAAFGTEAQKAKYLLPLCDGTQVGVNAMSEPGAGSDLGSISATAVKDGDGYRINGVKTLGTNGPVADIALVFAVTDPDANAQARLSGFIVDTKTEGFSVTERFETMGHRTVPLGELKLENVYVPAENLLSGKQGGGVGMFNHAMMWERVGLFAAHAGAMQRILEQTIKFARKRVQSGQPIAKFQGVSHKIADMKVRLEASKLLIYKAATQLDTSRMASFDASIAKLFTSEAFVQSAMDAMQILGGVGYLTGKYSIERDLRDALGSTLYSGTSEVQRNIIAAWLGL
ncbi:MAG: alkylation response protein AidB-like acyl-CoA dehydrogenase [Verrucomicrobiales bacterium]|jgi:alkylation response protein AidB-like acyl-CoA dehydrogenase